jgi:hypothetical protein
VPRVCGVEHLHLTARVVTSAARQWLCALSTPAPCGRGSALVHCVSRGEKAHLDLTAARRRSTSKLIQANAHKGEARAQPTRAEGAVVRIAGCLHTHAQTHRAVCVSS